MKLKISEVKLNQSNPRTIKDIKFKKLVNSIKEFPEMLELRPIVIDEDNIILGGNMRYRACVEAGLTEVFVKVAKGLTEAQKQEFIVKDNVGFGEWEWDILANDWNSAKLDEWGLDVWQNIDEQEVEPEEAAYTQQIEAPIYSPSDEKPAASELINETVTNKLIAEIENSKISKDEKHFLIKAAQRHIEFNYKTIADFYANSNKEVQELMENSALVIIDFKKAIELGYVKLAKNIENQFIEDYEE
jgi:hypothetical protein|tara:strand:- start:2008 stop:2742 length:735 start_codon:yes stop_codon:yes gene_type:complete